MRRLIIGSRFIVLFAVAAAALAAGALIYGTIATVRVTVELFTAAK